MQLRTARDHYEALCLTIEWVRNHGFVPSPEHWFTLSDKWNESHKIRVDAACLSDEGHPLMIIEVGGVGSVWHYALAQEIPSFHLSLSTKDLSPHPFGFCSSCCLTVPKEVYTLENVVGTRASKKFYSSILRGDV